MREEQDIIDRLRDIPMPPDLLPVPDAASAAIRRDAANRGRRALIAVVAVAAVFIGGSALVGKIREAPAERPHPTYQSSQYPESELPRPGGGPMVMQSFDVSEDDHYLLDLRSGRYQSVPYTAAPSPDQRTVMVHRFVYETDKPGAQFGYADREDYLDYGPAVVTWVGDLGRGQGIPSIGQTWSPDGKKFLTTYLAPGSSTDGFSEPEQVAVIACDVTTGETRVTTFPADAKIESLSWAADSATYLAVQSVAENQYRLVAMDAGAVITPLRDIEAHTRPEIVGLSPDGRFLSYTYRLNSESQGGIGGKTIVVEMSEYRRYSMSVHIDWDQVFFTQGIEWYDKDTLVRWSYRHGVAQVELVSAIDGGVERTLDWTYGIDVIHFGTSSGLRPEDAELGL